MFSLSGNRDNVGFLDWALLDSCPVNPKLEIKLLGVHFDFSDFLSPLCRKSLRSFGNLGARNPERDHYTLQGTGASFLFWRPHSEAAGVFFLGRMRLFAIARAEPLVFLHARAVNKEKSFMNVEEFRRQCPKLYQQVFALGVRGERRRLEAAELIAGAVEDRDRAPVNFALVPVKVAGNGGPAFVVPTY